MTRPSFRIKRRKNGWGIQVKWPRNGPWTHYQIWPHWVWWGPFGFTDFVYIKGQDALDTANIMQRSVDRLIPS